MTSRRPTPPPISTSRLRLAFAPVRRAAAGLAGVEAGTSYGTPALKLRGKLLARLKEDGETLVLRVDFDSRDAMLKAQPRLFFITDHYRDYPAVLLRLPVVKPARLRELLADSWRYLAPRSRIAKPEGAGRPGRSP